MCKTAYTVKPVKMEPVPGKRYRPLKHAKLETCLKWNCPPVPCDSVLGGFTVLMFL